MARMVRGSPALAYSSAVCSIEREYWWSGERSRLVASVRGWSSVTDSGYRGAPPPRAGYPQLRKIGADCAYGLLKSEPRHVDENGFPAKEQLAFTAS